MALRQRLVQFFIGCFVVVLVGSGFYGVTLTRAFREAKANEKQLVHSNFQISTAFRKYEAKKGRLMDHLGGVSANKLRKGVPPTRTNVDSILQSKIENDVEPPLPTHKTDRNPVRHDSEGVNVAPVPKELLLSEPTDPDQDLTLTEKSATDKELDITRKIILDDENEDDENEEENDPTIGKRVMRGTRDLTINYGNNNRRGATRGRGRKNGKKPVGKAPNKASKRFPALSTSMVSSDEVMFLVPYGTNNGWWDNKCYAVPRLPAIQSPRIGIVSFYSDPQWLEKIAACPLRSMQLFARRHNHEYIVYNNDNASFSQHVKDLVNPQCQKLPLLLKTLEDRPDLDYIVWMDSDAFINTKDSLAEFLKPYVNSRFNILLAQDLIGLNTGMWFLRNSPWTIEFLKKLRVPMDKTFCKQVNPEGRAFRLMLMDHLKASNFEEAFCHILLFPCSQEYYVNEAATDISQPVMWSKPHKCPWMGGLQEYYTAKRKPKGGDAIMHHCVGLCKRPKSLSTFLRDCEAVVRQF